VRVDQQARPGRPEAGVDQGVLSDRSHLDRRRAQRAQLSRQRLDHRALISGGILGVEGHQFGQTRRERHREFDLLA
jgi:hypothetical protein